MPTFTTAFSQVLTSNQPGWMNYTLRQRLGSALFAATGDTVRITFRSSDLGGLSITRAFIGTKGVGTYDFASAPTPITFDGGSVTKVVGATTDVVTDEIPFVVDGINDVIISIYFASGVASNIKRITPHATDYGAGFRAGDFADTLATSFSNDSTGIMVQLFEVATVGGGGGGETPVNLSQAPLLVMRDATVKDALVSQLATLVLTVPGQAANLSQAPLLIINEPLQRSKITQAPIITAWQPKPIPLPLPIVPEVPVKEGWQFSTVVTEAERGKEQRSTLRGNPRINMSFSALLLSDLDRLEAYKLLSKFVKQAFAYPLYQYSATVTQAALIGDTKLYFDPSETDLRAGEALALVHPTFDTTHYTTVVSVDLDGATVEPLTLDVGRNWKACPAAEFRVPPIVGLSMEATTGNFSLSMTTTGVRSVLRPDQPTGLVSIVDGLPLLDEKQLASNDVDEEFDQNVSWLDNGIAAPVARTSWPVPFISGERNFLAHRYGSATGLDYWREFASLVRGRLKPFLLPTYRNDLPVSETPLVGALSFVTSNIHFFEFWRSRAWQYLLLTTNTGSVLNRILEVLPNYDANGDPVTLTIKVASPITSVDNLVVSYVNRCRLDSDEISLLHGPVDTIVSLKVRTVEE